VCSHCLVWGLTFELSGRSRPAAQGKMLNRPGGHPVEVRSSEG
jgi:hypothetical protein